MQTLTLKPRDIPRYWSKVDKSGECWLWTAALNNRGYGTFTVRDTKQYAHRVSFTEAYGPIDESLVLDHMCHNPRCVRPEHLQAVSKKQNSENRAGPMKNSVTGVRGVCPSKNGTFIAQVAVNGVPMKLGTFKTIAEAEQCVIQGRLKHYTNSQSDLI